MAVEPLILVSMVLSAVAVVLGLGILYRLARTSPTIPPILEQRLRSLEAAIGKSDGAVREEFGRHRDETRETSKNG